MLRISLFSQDMLNVCNCSLQCFRQSSKSIACRLDMKPCKAKECLAQTSQGWWPNNGDTMVDLSHHPRAHHISKFPNALRNNFPQNGHFHIEVHEKGEPSTSQHQTNFITTFISYCDILNKKFVKCISSIQSMSWVFPLKKQGKRIASFHVAHN